MIGTDDFVQVVNIHTGVLDFQHIQGDHSCFLLFPGRQNGGTSLAICKGPLEEVPEF